MQARCHKSEAPFTNSENWKDPIPVVVAPALCCNWLLLPNLLSSLCSWPTTSWWLCNEAFWRHRFHSQRHHHSCLNALLQQEMNEPLCCNNSCMGGCRTALQGPHFTSHSVASPVIFWFRFLQLLASNRKPITTERNRILETFVPFATMMQSLFTFGFQQWHVVAIKCVDRRLWDAEASCAPVDFYVPTVLICCFMVLGASLSIFLRENGNALFARVYSE